MMICAIAACARLSTLSKMKYDVLELRDKCYDKCDVIVPN
jgi:hypothetical protein